MKQVYHIISEKKTEAEQQVLSIRVGERHFGFAITTPHAGELYKLSWYTDTEINKFTLDEIYLRHPELHHTYQSVFICYDYAQSIMVPMDKYNKEDAKLMLQTMFGVAGRDAVINEPVSGWQMHNVYAVPREVYDWTYDHFKTGNYWHSYTIGIKNVITTDFEGSLAADFRSDDFSLVVTKGNKLLLTQTFPYSTPADFIYYLLDTCRQFSFAQETVRVYLSGLIDKESALYKELHQYFLHIQFRQSEWKISPSEELRYPAHFFTSLNDLAKCVL